MDFDTLSSLKKKGVLQVEQKWINNISPAAEAKRKKEAQERAKREQKEASSSQTNQNTNRASASVTYMTEADNKAPTGGTQYYNVGCSDGTYGLAYITDVGKSYGSICFNNLQRGTTTCNIKSQWSLSLAAQALCGN